MYRFISRLLIVFLSLGILFIGENLGSKIEVYKYIIETPLVETYPISFGSGIYFTGREKEDLIFMSITDRGPNADSPEVIIEGKTYPTKIFPVPDYSPQVGYIRLTEDKAFIYEFFDILGKDKKKASGRPIPLNTLGTTGEIPLDKDLNIIDFDDQGIDPEGITVDHEGYIWICEEYGPSIIKIDPKSYEILERYYPGRKLPDILKWRQPNRGFEAIAFQNGKIYAVVQSTLDVEGKTKNNVNFLRIVELDLATEKVNMYAYPLDNDYSKYSDGMAGDMVSLEDKKFLIIERGKLPKGYKNIVYMIDLNKVLPLPEDIDEKKLSTGKLEDKYYVEKKKIVDLRELGYTWEKSEGLTIIDENTIAVINDNDFGIKSNISSFKSPQLIEKRIIEKDTQKDVTKDFRIIPNNEPLELWIIKLPFSLKELK